MSIIAGIVAPHPPLLIPAIGGAEADKVRATAEALDRVGAVLAEHEPDTLVFISPHSPMIEAAFAVRTGQCAQGSFARFGRPDIEFDLPVDVELAQAIAADAETAGLTVQRIEDARGLDWGVMVPYYFIGDGRPIVSLSISGLDYQDHEAWGRAVKRSAEAMGRKVAFVASGDLSHKLSPESPYGFSPAGESFESEVVSIFNSRRLKDLSTIDPDLVEQAAECGLRSFIALAGALEDLTLEGGTLAHEGPFGVGYAVALFEASDAQDV